MSPEGLEQVLRQLHIPPDPNVLVGSNTADDAGVYRLTDDLALVQTVDFFTAMVDDPYSFGLVAAANALSDVYAMGARPVTALNIIGFPENKLPTDILVRILRGGLDKAVEAGVCVVGGHTVKDDEIKYGMAVTGLIHPDAVITNAGARPGDRLILTKPLGSGIVTTAIKREMAEPAEIEEITKLMATLNRAASEAMIEIGARGCTDITGFGLLGHLHEMTAASGVSAVVFAPEAPILPSARKYAALGAVPGGSKSNLKFLGPFVEFAPEVDELTRILLADAQTSGGLLISVPPGKAAALRERLAAAGVNSAAEIGEIRAGTAGTIHVAG
jgi:selenide,water dikinase